MARSYKLSGNGLRKWVNKYEIYEEIKLIFKNNKNNSK